MKNTLGGRIRELRDDKDMSQKEFGKLFNLAESTIGMYERDSRKPSYETLQKMADYFSVTREYLLSGEDKSINVDAIYEEREFQRVINDPELERWYKELPKSREEDLRKLRKMWDIIKNEDK